jgi:hypothetical protein
VLCTSSLAGEKLGDPCWTDFSPAQDEALERCSLPLWRFESMSMELGAEIDQAVRQPTKQRS